MKINMDIEEIFASRGRTRIIKTLIIEKEMNISELAKRTGLSYTSVNRHLEELKKKGVIMEKRFGRIRIFKINEQNKVAKAIEEFIMKT
ncbi:MAG: winged helix-turn-helix domain-containing protein [archaeon GBS-70-058]|nr:winged helix-turn-helix domain-containing protein [Candidatus Culexarchaeum nevadense]